MLQQHQHHLQSVVAAAPPPSSSTTTSTPPSSTTGEAPPKQVAQAMDRLGQTARLIADIRLVADRLLEALFALCSRIKAPNLSTCSAKKTNPPTLPIPPHRWKAAGGIWSVE